MNDEIFAKAIAVKKKQDAQRSAESAQQDRFARELFEIFFQKVGAEQKALEAAGKTVSMGSNAVQVGLMHYSYQNGAIYKHDNKLNLPRSNDPKLIEAWIAARVQEIIG